METLPVGLSEMPDSTAFRWFSDNSQRDVRFDKDMVRRTDWSGGRAADIVREICQNVVLCVLCCVGSVVCVQETIWKGDRVRRLVGGYKLLHMG